MASFEARHGKIKAAVRRVGFAHRTATFDTMEEAKAWAKDLEVAFKEIRTGVVKPGSSRRERKGEKTQPDYLYVHGGRDQRVELRPYQGAAVRALLHALLGANKEAPLASMPTGSGKTIVINGVIEMLLEIYTDARFLVLTASQELVQQNYDRFCEYACVELSEVGLAAASLGVVQLHRRITFGMIQTLASRTYDEKIDFILIDEAHMVPRADTSRYQRLIADTRATNPKLRIMGLTATPYRLDSGLLTEGVDALFTRICYQADIIELVRDGYLSPLISAGSKTHIDDSALKLKVGEFTPGSASAALLPITDVILNDVLERSTGRRSWLLFCPTTSYASLVRDKLMILGVSAAVITGKTPAKKRSAILADHAAGKTKALVNVNVLTTGFDAPYIDLLVSLRPTASTSLWVQMCGRGMRKAKGKVDCLILDYANNIARHGPIDRIDAELFNNPKNAVWSGSRSSLLCEACGCHCSPRNVVCPNCGTPLRDESLASLEAGASNLPVMSLAVSNEDGRKRLADLRNITVYIDVADIAGRLGVQRLLKDPYRESRHDSLRKGYRDLVKHNCYENDGRYTFEPGLSIQEVAPMFDMAPEELHRAIKDGRFIRPTLAISDDDETVIGYSLMQVAVMKSIYANRYIELDESFLLYQEEIAALELELAARNALGDDENQLVLEGSAKR